MDEKNNKMISGFMVVAALILIVSSAFYFFYHKEPVSERITSVGENHEAAALNTAHNVDSVIDRLNTLDSKINGVYSISFAILGMIFLLLVEKRAKN